MKKISNFIVDKKYFLLVLYLVFIAFSLWGMFNVNINYDMSKYLPNDSNVKIGMEKMVDEFGENSSIIVMFKDLNEEQRKEVSDKLLSLDHVESVAYDSSSLDYQKDGYSKYVITIDSNTYSSESRNVLNEIQYLYPNAYYKGEVVDNDLSISTLSSQIPIIAIVAVIVIFLILFILSDSWIEPFVFMTCIGIAILINMGTNALFPSVSYMTNAVGALLQMGLSMDYSIMLMNSYNKYKLAGEDSVDAMKDALHESFTTITCSSITTIVGLLVLVFMSFKIGADMGLVLAKGIFISLITIFTLLPGLIVIFDKLINKTKKKSLNIKLNKIMHFVGKTSAIIVALAMLFICLSLVFKDDINISFLNNVDNKDEVVIEQVFGKENQTILLYDNSESKEHIDSITKWLNENDNVTAVNDYYNTIGVELNYNEFAYAYNINTDEAKMLYQIYAKFNGISDVDSVKIQLDTLLAFVSDNLLNNETYQNLIPQELKVMIEQGLLQINDAKKQMVGKNYNRMIINTNLSIEGEEMYDFIKKVSDKLNTNFDNEFYLIGNSAMASEMNNSFKKELNFVTILSVAAIFVIVLITFKNLISSLVLVCTIQGAIMITTMIVVFTNMTANYIALILVQCILMGATIDYGILLMNNYIKTRECCNKYDAIAIAMNDSIKTIITSSLILIGCCLSVALLMKDDVISSTCLIIAIGVICAVIMVVFVLPAIILLLDKIIYRKKLNKDYNNVLEK